MTNLIFNHFIRRKQLSLPRICNTQNEKPESTSKEAFHDIIGVICCVVEAIIYARTATRTIYNTSNNDTTTTKLYVKPRRVSTSTCEVWLVVSLWKVIFLVTHQEREQQLPQSIHLQDTLPLYQTLLEIMPVPKITYVLISLHSHTIA